MLCSSLSMGNQPPVCLNGEEEGLRGVFLFFFMLLYIAQTEVKSLMQKSLGGNYIGYVIQEGRSRNHKPSLSLKSIKVIHFSWQIVTGWRKGISSSAVNMYCFSYICASITSSCEIQIVLEDRLHLSS